MTGQSPPEIKPNHPSVEDPRFAPAIDVLRRTGASAVEIRYQDDYEPTIWIAAAHYKIDEQGVPSPDGVRETHEAAAAMNPLHAVFRLCDEIVDGGSCAHCQRPTGFDRSDPDEPPMTAAMLRVVCWFYFDWDAGTFVQSCKQERASGQSR